MHEIIVSYMEAIMLADKITLYHGRKRSNEKMPVVVHPNCYFTYASLDGTVLQMILPF